MTSAAPTSGRSRRAAPRRLALPLAGIAAAALLIGVGASLAGRRDEQLPTAYGRRRGGDAQRSVNGTAVLADMFKKAGHRVTTFQRLSPRVQDFDVVVWFPNDFAPPTPQQREFLENWLAQGAERTVVYVGRDYDAAVAYWNEIAPQAPAAQADEVLRRQAEARAAHEAARSQMPRSESVRWFVAKRDQPPAAIKQVSGPWARDIDASAARLHLEGRLEIPTKADTAGSEPTADKFRVLLGTPSGPLVTRVTNDELWHNGQILVVANGSFLLNYPLVNHEHRKLATRLVNACGPDKKVLFLESGPGGPAVLDKEPASGPVTAFELLQVWPLNAILLHLTVLGIVFCLSQAAIFGRPRELPPEPTADFGKHVAAMGQLLARTGDRHYAQARITQYRQFAERKSGRSHLKSK